MFRTHTKEKNWIQYLDKSDNDGYYRCVYCGHKIKYSGTCRTCGDAEDAHLQQGYYPE